MERIKVKPFNFGKGAEKHEFMADAPYYRPADEKILKQLISGLVGYKAVVVFTQVIYDRGTRYVERFGIPRLESYDNGWEGLQSLDFYESVEEAKRELELKKLVSNRYYVDLFMVTL